jgi:hypothetical protein
MKNRPEAARIGAGAGDYVASAHEIRANTPRSLTPWAWLPRFSC